MVAQATRRNQYHQMPGAPEGRVQHQGRDRRVQPDDRRDARNRGVRKSFCDEHRPHRQADESIGTNPSRACTLRAMETPAGWIVRSDSSTFVADDVQGVVKVRHNLRG